jgi:hypothetical protein
MNDLGKIAYEAYCESRDWKSYNGQPLPGFENQDNDLQKAWRRAGHAVSQAIGWTRLEALLVGAISGACIASLIQAIINALR